MTMPSQADLEIVAKMPVFRALAPDTLRTLLAEASVLNFRHGKTLFRQGEPAIAVFVILSGWVKLYRVTPTGDEAVLNVLTHDDCLADAVTFAGGIHAASAGVVSAARILFIPADHVVHCVRQTPALAVAMMTASAQQLQSLSQRVEQLTVFSATQRVADFIAALAPCVNGACTIALPYDKSLIAGYLGLKPESLSRVFAKLRRIGVDVQASKVRVEDIARLRRLVLCDRIGPRDGEARLREPPLRQGLEAKPVASSSSKSIRV
ncbi:Crp/Fnr family transcriptional regulator [Bradyrhizobium sp. HKCCYLS20291]|uniref:Crp/Fnr family transcriptional regulator n=1 Tax=Bradyrhizobium sp. HKCCYLS20291 TaxID=3420766 RepID=UPI003EB7DC0E